MGNSRNIRPAALRFRVITLVFSSLTLLLFLAFSFGEPISTIVKYRNVLSWDYYLEFALAGLPSMALILAYFRPLYGGIIAIISSLFWVFLNGFVFGMGMASWFNFYFLITLAGILHLVSWFLLRQKTPEA